jgi:hypothetical protein
MWGLDQLLKPFFGYVYLKMFEDANDVLEGLPTNLITHPTVLLARLELLMEVKMWREGVLLGQSLCNVWPSELEFWFRTAYCQHEMKHTQQAKDTLLRAPPAMRETATFHFNLACYETQLGNLEEGKRLLFIAIEKNKEFQQDALDDPDLEPMWDSLRTGWPGST